MKLKLTINNLKRVKNTVFLGSWIVDNVKKKYEEGLKKQKVISGSFKIISEAKSKSETKIVKDLHFLAVEYGSEA